MNNLMKCKKKIINYGSTNIKGKDKKNMKKKENNPTLNKTK